MRGTDAPAPAPAPADHAEMEAKPRQPVHDPDARGDRDVEAKPSTDGLPSPRSANDAAASSNDDDRPDAPPTGGRRAA